MGHEKLINAVKKIMESEIGLGEMARKAYNNTLTQKGKDEITAAVKKMIASDKEGKSNHAENFAFKALHFLAKQKVGEPVLTTDIQKSAGVKFPQPINKLLSTLVASEYLERATSHVEPEKGEAKPKGRPKGPEKEKVEKPEKLGGLQLKKPIKPEVPAAGEDDNAKNLAENGMSLDELEAELNESEEVSVNEESIESIEQKLVTQFGSDGNGGNQDSEDNLDEYKELHGGVGAEQGMEAEDALKDDDEVKEQLNESFLIMQHRAGIITDTQLAQKRRLLK